MGPALFVLFLVVPLAEIYVLIQVGGVVGAGLTVLLVVGTAALGAALIRVQGMATLARVRESLDRGELPAVALLEGLLLLVAGALLLTPGFLTDSVGFCLLVPPWRRALAGALLEAGLIRGRPGPGGSGDGGGRVIEGEYRREDDPG